MTGIERVAREFHETYEELARHFGYDTRPESAKAWESVPFPNRMLMQAVVGSLKARGIIEIPPGPSAPDESEVGDGR